MSKLTIIFYIALCLEAGIVLTLLPWVHPFGLGDWGDNYFLLYAAQKIGLQGLQHAVASGWVRGAVTGLGILNLSMAFWEMAHFRQTVRALRAQEEGGDAAAPSAEKTSPADAARTSGAAHVSDHERRDDQRDHAGE